MTEDPAYKSALGNAMALCAQREYCSSDIRMKLKGQGLERHDISSIIDVLKKEKFIDEERYAKAFVRDRFFQNRWGKIKIAAQLRAKTISESIIDKALEEIDKDLYRDTVTEIMNDHRKKTKANTRYELKGKLLRFGLSRGFESNLLYDILNDLISE